MRPLATIEKAHAEARNDTPDLLDEVHRLRGLLATARGWLEDASAYWGTDAGRKFSDQLDAELVTWAVDAGATEEQIDKVLTAKPATCADTGTPCDDGHEGPPCTHSDAVAGPPNAPMERTVWWVRRLASGDPEPLDEDGKPAGEGGYYSASQVYGVTVWEYTAVLCWVATGVRDLRELRRRAIADAPNGLLYTPINVYFARLEEQLRFHP